MHAARRSAGCATLLATFLASLVAFLASLVASLVATADLAPANPPSTAGLLDPRHRPDALWRIVSTCLPPTAPSPSLGHCTCPAFERSCCDDPTTPDAAVIWAETAEFVAIRDMKMCGCGPLFVAGLAIPRARVSGIEDPARPEAIWPFAWNVARSRIAEPLEIGLAINPEDVRSQNQMHVHMLRLKPGVRAGLDRAIESGRMDERATAIAIRLPNLERVFDTAADFVRDQRLDDRGILVAMARDGGFVALVTDRQSPQAYTKNTCR